MVSEEAALAMIWGHAAGNDHEDDAEVGDEIADVLGSLADADHTAEDEVEQQDGPEKCGCCACGYFGDVACHDQDRTIEQQEKQQVEHDKKTDEKVEGALADTQGLRGKKLAAPGEPFRDPLLHQPEVVHAEAVEQTGDPGRQGLVDLLEIPRHAEFTRLHALVNTAAFLDQQPRHDAEGRERGWGGGLPKRAICLPEGVHQSPSPLE